MRLDKTDRICLTVLAILITGIAALLTKMTAADLAVCDGFFADVPRWTCLFSTKLEVRRDR